MAWIQPVKFDMDWSNAILEARPKNRVVAAIQKLAICLIVPFALVVFTEAVVKNIIVNNALCISITLLNKIHELLYGKIEGAGTAG